MTMKTYYVLYEPAGQGYARYSAKEGWTFTWFLGRAARFLTWEAAQALVNQFHEEGRLRVAILRLRAAPST